MFYFLQTVATLLAALPRSAALKVGAASGWLIGCVARFRRRQVLESLALCFPGRGRSELEHIATRMYRNLCMTAVEMFRLERKGYADSDGHVRVHGGTVIDAIAASNKGALLLMGHIGNWELTGYALQRVGKPIHVVVKPIRSPGSSRFMLELRRKLGIQPIEWRQAFRTCMSALKRGEIVAIVLDQNTKRDYGIFVDFMGRPACTSPGLAILAAQTGTPVYPFYATRAPDGSHDVTMMPPLDPPTDKSREAMHDATQRYTKVLEDIIREHPENWMWLHKRWRTQAKPDLATDRDDDA